MTEREGVEAYLLPCDVHLPPATVVKAGCTLATLKLAMEAPFRPRHFDGPARLSTSSDAGRGDREAIARIVHRARFMAKFGKDFRADDERPDHIDLNAADAILALPSATQPPERGAVEAVTDDTFCICCCRRKGDHERGQCPETTYFVPRAAALSTAAAAPTPATNQAGEVEQSTIAFVQEWMMSGDHKPDKWHRDFAAAIDARAALAAAPHVEREGES